jgi:hypothetical protein
VLYEGTVAEELKMLVSLVTSQASGCRCIVRMLFGTKPRVLW